MNNSLSFQSDPIRQRETNQRLEIQTENKRINCNERLAQMVKEHPDLHREGRKLRF